jgi:nitrogen regulatory protein PII
MVESAKMKLVTIIASSELLDRLTVGLRKLGVPGYTTVAVNGRGLHGPRARGVFDSGNVRLETVVSPALGAALLEYLAADYEDIVVFAHDVEALARKQRG